MDWDGVCVFYSEKPNEDRYTLEKQQLTGILKGPQADSNEQ